MTRAALFRPLAVLVLCCASLMALGKASAQALAAPATPQLPAAEERWAVQVVALRDFREAQEQAASLRTLGFDAYTEFAMLNGQQWVRVRVGCFASRGAAEATAAALRARITADAQAVEFSSFTHAKGCTEEDIGFLNGYGWRLISDQGPVTFAVNVAGVPAVVAHDGSRWRIVQDDDQLQLQVSATPPASFEARRIGGVSFVGLAGDLGPVIVCPGELVASVADVAIVERGDLLVACRYLLTPSDAVLR